MARIQILELPEGSSDDRPPFILVVDQVAELEDYWSFTDNPERLGARAVLVFADTIDIPANDVPPTVDEVFKSDIENWATGTNETIKRIVEAMSHPRNRAPRSDTARSHEEQP